MPVRVTVLLAPAVLLGLLVAPAPAAGAERGCPARATCSRVAVPLDRADPGAGKLRLLVARRPAGGRRRGTVLVLAGGPGESAVSGFATTLALLGEPILRRFDVVSFDARGTGRSGVVRCPALQRDPRQRSAAAAAACAARLGSRRGAYVSDAQVADIEDVRRALRVARLDLYGTSFGTKIAMRYAQEHPERVGRLLLDSTLRPSGPSALGDEVFGSLPRVLRDMCARPRCTLTRDLFGDVAALVARLRARPLRAAVFDERGRSRTAALGPVTLVDLLLEGDFVPALREALPAAIVAARAGDAAPLLRLARLDLRATPDFPVREFSSGAYAAGSCEDIPMPWDPAADPATRERQARERLAAEPRARFAPFDAATVLQADYLSLCRRWPAPARAPVPASDVLPDVPMLFLQGEQDLRTPLEDARELAAGLPRAVVLSVPRVGHAVLVSDPTGCARRAARRFLLRRTVRGGRCPSARPVLRPVGVPPPSLAKVRRVAGLPPRIGRTLHAVDLALDDVTLAFAIGAPSGGGLRGGSFRSGPRGLVLRDFAYVPGVALTTVRRGGRLVLVVRGAAAARGRITLAGDGRFRGVLGGRRVRGRLSGGAPA